MFLKKTLGESPYLSVRGKSLILFMYFYGNRLCVIFQ